MAHINCKNVPSTYTIQKGKIEKTEYLYEVVFVDILKYELNIFNHNLAS